MLKRILTTARQWAPVLFTMLLTTTAATAQQADNENGTYTNPLIWADFPDNDVIRVGDTYYMVTTTMNFFPGVPVMQSKDLVNWQYLSNAVDRFDAHPFYNLEGGNRYSHGQWASSLRYHNSTFYILFVTLDEGGFLCTASSAAGPWKLTKLPKAYYDSGLFFDDDGRIYVVHGYSKLTLTEVNADLSPKSEDKVIFDKVQRKGLEGTHVYKINGYYYLYCTYGGGDGYQVALRSKNIGGPYEEKVVLRDDLNRTGKGVHQGALVQTQTGEWWSVIFQDRDAIGRVPTLQPVTWVDGWPMLGQDGRAVVTYKKPNVGKNWPVTTLPTSDEFAAGTLGLQWAWNHNPDDQHWSLTERPGYLRLKTAKVVAALPEARNTLTQRPFGPYSHGTLALDVSQMRDGDVAGLALLQEPYGYVGVKMQAGKKQVVMVNNGQEIAARECPQSKIYLRADVDAVTDRATFFFSPDNRQFTPLGNELAMQFDLKYFIGNKFCLFNYATQALGGQVDADWFRVDVRQGPPNLFAASGRIEAERYDHLHGADTEMCPTEPTPKGEAMTDLRNGSWLQFDQLDFGKGARQLQVRAAASSPGSVIEAHLDGPTGPLLGTCAVPATGGPDTYATLTAPIAKTKGRHPVVLKVTGGEGQLLKLNWFSFQK